MRIATIAACVLSLMIGLAAPPPARAADSADAIYRRADLILRVQKPDQALFGFMELLIGHRGAAVLPHRDLLPLGEWRGGV